MTLADLEQSLRIVEHVIVATFFLTPIIGNRIAEGLRLAGAESAARKVDAYIPYAQGAIREIRKIEQLAEIIKVTPDELLRAGTQSLSQTMVAPSGQLQMPDGPTPTPAPENQDPPEVPK